MSDKNTVLLESPDDIDLVELILSIWKRKWWVILVTAIFACASIAYALLKTEL